MEKDRGIYRCRQRDRQWYKDRQMFLRKKHLCPKAEVGVDTRVGKSRKVRRQRPRIYAYR